MPNQTIVVNNVSVVQHGPMTRLIDPQKVYSDVMKDAARRAVLEKNVYPNGRKPDAAAVGSSGDAIKSVGGSKRNRAQRALYEGSSSQKKDLVPLRKPPSKA